MEVNEYIAKRIRELRTEKLRITGNELGKLLDPKISGKTISSWETGRTKPRTEALLQLSQIFDVPIMSFYPDGSSEDMTIVSDSAYIDVPLYGTIAAGKALQVIPYENTHPVPIEMFKRYPNAFLLRVEGESMNNVLPNGAYALIDPDQKQPLNGEAYALCLNESDATIKRIKKLENGYELIPDSKDPTFKSAIYDCSVEDPDEIAIIGRVVWMMLPFDWEF